MPAHLRNRRLHACQICSLYLTKGEQTHQFWVPKPGSPGGGSLRPHTAAPDRAASRASGASAVRRDADRGAVRGRCRFVSPSRTRYGVTLLNCLTNVAPGAGEGNAVRPWRTLQSVGRLAREVVPTLVEVEVAVPRLTPAIW